MQPKGFTMIEAIVVVALMAGLALLAPVFLGGRVASEALDAAAGKAVDVLIEARSAAMAGRNNVRHGVRFTASNFTIFEGTAFNPADSNNLITTLAGDVTASSISISGGGADIQFASRKGIPVQTGSVTFTDGAGNTKTITVNAAGRIVAQ